MKYKTGALIIILLLIVAVGIMYQNNKTKTPYVKQFPFSVKIESVDSIGINEELSVVAVIRNTTDQTHMIQHGITVFKFLVFDINGKLLNTSKRPSVMKDTTVEASGTIEEKFSYIFKEPGIYYVEAIADISVSNGEPYQLTTDKKKVTIK
ncbi:hypothetical protein [Paenibacillus ginsengarvi]|nr:hypothetical protein [Paenibacillus ginsengarvi]